MRYLSTFKPGTRFRLAEMHEVTGTLIKVNDCRAVVRLDRPERDVEFVDQAGETRQFKSRGTKETSWAPTTLVEPVGFQTLNDEEMTMSKTATKKTTKAPKTAMTKAKAPKADASSASNTTTADKPAKAPKAAKADGKLSCIDAAAKVLAETKEPMGTKEMIEQMAKKGYWSSPGGKTPSAT